MRYLKWLWIGLRKLVGLVLPFWAKARDYQGWGAGLFWTLRLLLLVVLFVAFLFLQMYLDDRYGLTSKTLGKGLQPLKGIWLPAFVILVLLFFWVGWWVWKLWMQEEEESPFPDIDAAWNEAVQALHRAGIGIGDAPLFLVLGWPTAGGESLFKASKVDWKLDSVPEREEAPVHVYASREAIFVTCAGASVLGHYATVLASGRTAGPESPGREQEDARIYQSVTDVNATIGPEGRAQLVKEILAEAERAKRPLTEGEKQFLKYLGYAPDAAMASGAKAGAAALFKDAKEIDRHRARLEHLCRLIVRDRRPYCPANGLLLLIPFSGTDEKNATHAATFCQRDITVVREIFRLHFPTLALVCDMEKAPGFLEFVRRFPQGARDRRFGQSFPWIPDVSPAKLPQTLENGIGWVCHSLPAFWVYKFFQLEAADSNAAEVVHGNAQVFQLMAEMGLRHTYLSRILLQALTPERTPLLLFGGCYLAGTGRKEQEKAFLPGIFDKLMKTRTRDIPMQNLVYWTQQALDADAAHHWWATRGWFATAGLLIFALAMLALLFLWR